MITLHGAENGRVRAMTQIDFNHPDVRDTIARQYTASAPHLSAWVSANAGSGKTHVLTQRVIRLLIGDEERGLPAAAPDKIVCITYTKAAAAEMSERLFQRLSSWALADDVTLAKELASVAGGDLSAMALSRSRKLFAQALETPGGLKIQTIHSFCEGILRRFPAEAGVLPGFTVLEEAEQTALMDVAMAEGATSTDAGLATAYQTLFSHIGDESARRGLIREAMKGEPGTPSMARRVYGLPGVGGVDDWKTACLRAISPGDIRQLAAVSSLAGETDRVKIATLGRLLDEPASPSLFNDVAGAWLNADWKKAKPSKGNKHVRVPCPEYQEIFARIIDALFDTVCAIKGLPRYELSQALSLIGQQVRKRIATAKEARGSLDFDDIIHRTRDLLRDVGGEWVMYKLDQGIDHILLDEAQDTGAAQWDVIEAFVQEFIAMAGEGRRRTTFVVGDKKQSIYSFQGADARLFTEKRDLMRTAIGETMPFEDVPMALSFRSSQAVLDVVDATFVGRAGDGVLAEDEAAEAQHKAARVGAAGSVSLWPYLPKPVADDGEYWNLPVDSGGRRSPERQLADHICRDIQSRLSAEQSRRTPGDVLILCQRRSRQFHEILSALGRHGIPTAGADRVALRDDVAVRDMLAMLRFLSNKEDSLSLAELLRSPLYSWTEESLFELAHGRGARSLWSALRHRAAEGEGATAEADRRVVAEIDGAERVALEEGPYALLAHVLREGQPSGVQRFRRRLGMASDEALEELLNEAIEFEARAPRTTQGFLAHLERLTTDVKKDSGAAGDVVRVMTVHGAKGLEAPLVYLADATFKPEPRENTAPNVQADHPDAPDWLVLSGSKTFDSEMVAAARAARQARGMEEYRRLLYVALTRAADEAVICGIQTKSTPKEASGESPVDPTTATWHALVGQAMQRLSSSVQDTACLFSDVPIRVYATGVSPHPETPTAPAAAALAPARQEVGGGAELPAWLDAPRPAEAAKTIVFPSHDEDGSAQPGDAGLGPVWPPRLASADRVTARRRGTLIHRLLEVLPNHPLDQREGFAEALLSGLAGDLSPEIRKGYAAEALRVLNDPVFEAAFRPGGREEVSLRGRVGGKTYSGQVDRLWVGEDEVLVIDYKTHRPPPEDIGGVSVAIKNQMRIYAALLGQIYPGRAVRAALLWTHAPRLMMLPQDDLKE